MARRGDLNGWWLFGIAVVGFFWRIAFRPRVEGTDRVPRAGPAIVAANHVSALDGVVLALTTSSRSKRMTRFLVAAEFFRKIRFGWALRLYRQIPIRRGERDQGALDVAVETIRDGALAGIFPEGTVNPEPDAGLSRGRKGAARIALATGGGRLLRRADLAERSGGFGRGCPGIHRPRHGRHRRADGAGEEARGDIASVSRRVP